MHFEKRPMHVIWIFGSGFYVRRQVPRSNCCCLRFPHSPIHIYTQSDSHTHVRAHTYTFTCFGANWQRVTFSRITCVFHQFYSMVLCWSKSFEVWDPTKGIPRVLYFWRLLFKLNFPFFRIHFKVVFPHSILPFTFALALLTLSLLCLSLPFSAPFTNQRQPLSVDVDVDNAPLGHTHKYNTDTYIRIQTHEHTYRSSNIITAAKTKKTLLRLWANWNFHYFSHV